jgi:hypothetical protein
MQIMVVIESPNHVRLSKPEMRLAVLEALKDPNISIRVLEPVDYVSCSVCNWTGKLSDCNFGHDDYYCPNCGKEGGINHG